MLGKQKGNAIKVIKKENVIYNFSPEHVPTDTVNLDEDFWVETEDCYGGQMKTEKDLRPNIDLSIMDESTGPIRINNIVAGDVICVTIKEIELASQGVMATSPGLGPLGDMIKEPNTKIIHIKNGYAYFTEKIKLPLTPMIGVLGVAPKQGEIHCATPGDHGANMDTKDIKSGSKVYFPVFVNGANLAMGDLHACMGDGELSGTGIETAGRVKLNVVKVQTSKLLMPVVETEDAFMVISSEKTFKEAAKKGIKYSVELLQIVFNLNFPDAYRLLSATCDLRISQIVNPLITVRISIPKLLVKTLFG